MRQNKPTFIHYVLQAIYAAVYLWLVLVAMDLFTNRPGLLWAVGASSLASSAYIVFSKPCCRGALSLQLIGAYFVSILVGIACSHLSHAFWLHLSIGHTRSMELATSIAVGFSLLLQTIFRFQHPPAAGMSLVLTLDPWSFDGVMVIVVAVLLLACISWMLRFHLKDLSEED